MALFTKKPDRYQRALDEIYEITRVLQQEGQYDGKSRYLEIVAILLLSVDMSLHILRSLIACGLGVLIGHLLFRFL